MSLPLPEQEVDVSDAGWSLVYRDVLPVENWNAQISLLTGMGAAEVMLYGEVGVVRTLPDPPDFAVDRLRAYGGRPAPRVAPRASTTRTSSARSTRTRPPAPRC